MKKINLLVISGYYPNKEGESNYGTKAYSALIENYPNEIELSIAAHSAKSSDDPSFVHRLTGGEGRAAKFIRSILLIRFMLQKRPDIIHYQGVHTALYGGITGEPLLLLMFIARLLGIKNIITIHSTWTKRHLREWAANKRLNYLQKTIFMLYIAVYYRLLGCLMDRVNVLVAGGESDIYREFVADYKFSAGKTFSEIHPCTKNILKPCLSDNILTQTILAAGFVRPDKGLSELIDAFVVASSELPALRLAIVGEPQGNEGVKYADLLSRKVRLLGLEEKISLNFNYLSEEAFATYMDESDIVVLPYTRAIGASGPMHHALSRGLHVIASGVDQNLGMKGTINLYKNMDSNDLARAIIEAVRNEYSSVNIESFIDKYNWESLAKYYLNSYKTLLAEQ